MRKQKRISARSRAGGPRPIGPRYHRVRQLDLGIPAAGLADAQSEGTGVELSHLFNEMDASSWIEIGVVVALALILIVVSQRALSWTANRLHDRARFLVFAMIPLARLLILVAAAIWVVPIVIEPSLQNMVALLGAVGIAVGFALKDYVSSLIAGLVSAFELPYRPGDWIEVNGVYGEVKHVGTRTIELVTPDDTWVSIPHLKLWNEAIHNANNGGPSLQCVANFYPPAGSRCQCGLADFQRRGPDQPLPRDRQADRGHCTGASLRYALPGEGLSSRPAATIPLHLRPDTAREGCTAPAGRRSGDHPPVDRSDCILNSRRAEARPETPWDKDHDRGVADCI